MGVGIALSPAILRIGGGRMMSNIAVGSRQRRKSAGGRGGFGFGRKGPAQVTLSRIARAVGRARVGKRGGMMVVAGLRGGMVGIRVNFLWPVTTIVQPVTLLQDHFVWRIRLRFLVYCLVDLVQDLISPIADRRPYA